MANQSKGTPKKTKKIPNIRPKTINISADVMAGLEEHAYSNLEAEVGGMLFGTIKDGVANISGAIPAAKATAEQISLTFTHEVWDDILIKGNEHFPGQQIVGWYHTHPSFGLFLSDYDQFIQKNFFANPGQFALVIDPIAGNLGWFELRKNGQIPLIAQEDTKSGPRQNPGSISGGELKTHLNKWVIVGAAASIVCGAIGYGIGTLNAPVDQTEQLIYMSKLLNMKEGRIQGYVALNYEVQAGDSAENISKFFYGSVLGVDQILEANPNLEHKKENIKPGSTLLIINPTFLSLYQAPEVEPSQVEPDPSTTSTSRPKNTQTPQPKPTETKGAK
jgi:proteasome lid subunit RPN8/RPN11